VHNIIRKFSKSPKITVATIENKTQVLVEFLHSSDINNRTRKFLKWGDPMSFRNRSANIVVTKQASNAFLENKCAILECNNSSMAIYYVKTLRRVRRKFVAEFTPLKSISLKKKVSIDSALNNKPMSLCGEHHKLWRIF
jgi:5-enolpyruvylshikimate-3-phosphate synthase